MNELIWCCGSMSCVMCESYAVQLRPVVDVLVVPYSVAHDSHITHDMLPQHQINRLTPNDTYMGRTAPLTSKHRILYIYSTNIGTEYFKHALYSPFFSLQNAVCFIMLTCLIPVLFTFYIQGVLKLKKKIPAPKG